ncbi:hypothetical protein [Bacillus sp. B15-48]|uniref:hypothetical protein n=1 Tax=Bacillus sp. B15-48 TaxID=1548601 RepID=UPI00193EDFFB|nr:hypothetical protein [Bacillus sp. B15-48]MBM4764472.1 hypothetical protein [Bacillus sp. B15-48]
MVENGIGGREKIFIFLILFSLIFLQRTAITIGDLQLSPVFLLSLLSVIILYFFNEVEIDQKRFLLFLGAISALILASLYALIHSKAVGLASLLSVIAFYLPFIFVNKSKGSLKYILSTYQGMMMIVAILGIIQFSLQFVGINFIDPLKGVPEQFLLTGYYTYNPLFPGSPFFKANGMIMLEPSFYSKMLATGIIIEFLTKKRLKVMILFFIGMLLSFSGTGFIILAVIAVPILFNLKPIKVFALTILIGISVFVFFEKGYGEIFIERLNEFNTPRTSGHVRFVAPWLAYKEFVTIEDTGTVLFGTGAGTVQNYYGREYTFDEHSRVFNTAHPTAYIKLLVEYGVLGGLFFTIFIIYTFFSITKNRILLFALLINYSFLTASLLQSTTVFICFILGTFAAERLLSEDVRKEKWAKNESIQKNFSQSH